MENLYTVVLTDATTGTLYADELKIGDKVEIKGQDENGNHFYKTGIVEEIVIN